MAYRRGIALLLIVTSLLARTLVPGLVPPARADLSSDATVLPQVEDGLAAAINAERTTDGLSTLIDDPSLVDIARQRSEDQLDRDYFSHLSPDGTSVYDLLDADSIPWTAAGENLARVRGTDPVEASIAGFMASAEHRANVLDAAYTRFGVGVAAAGDGTVILTVVFLG